MSENELLLCTYDDTEGTGTFGTMTNDPKSSNDTLHPGSIEDLSNIVDTGASPKYWNGYVFKSVSNYIEGTCTVHVYKPQNGQEIEVGELPEVIGNSLDIKSTDSGLVLGDDLNFYRLIDTGQTVVTELVGLKPSLPCLIEASYGGYLFAKGTEYGPAKEEKAAILSEDDPTQVASIITISTGGQSSGCDVDSQTGEFVVTSQDGFKVAKLPQLDQNGKLPADFSLTELTFGPKVKLTDDAIRVTASNGYKYFEIGDGSGLMIATPDNQIYTIGKTELGIQGDCPNGNLCVMGVLKLESGGIYVIFNDDMNIAPVSLTPTANPAEFMSPTLPFKKITDEPSAITKHIINNGCAVVYGDKSMFQPAADPCDGVVCETANQCKEASCDPQSGECVEQNKPDETVCDDESVCTPFDKCFSGQCMSEEIVCDDNNPCTEEDPLCDPETGCNFVPLTGQACNDLLPCTTNDKCDANGGCKGTLKSCDDNNPCTADECDIANGSCMNDPDPMDGQNCNDGNSSTENDQCASGACQGTPIVNPEPEPDVVELNPEADVVEQGPDTVEQDNDIVEQKEITADAKPGDADDTSTTDIAADTAEDLTGDTEDTADNDDVNPEATTEITEELDTHDLLHVEGETATEEISSDIYTETQEVIAAEKDHPKKSPGGCGCNTASLSPDSMSGTLLLGAMLVGLAANMRYKILNALAKRS